jgi:hypothetical protein
MDNLQFGIPKKVKKEKDWNFMSDKPAIKISADKGSRQPKNIYLNQKAHDMLFGDVVEDKKIGVNFDLNHKLVRFANVEGLGVEFSRFTKNPPYKFSNSLTYNYLISFLELDNSVDNFYILAPDSFDYPCGSLQAINTTDEINELSKVTVEADPIFETESPEIIEEVISVVEAVVIAETVEEPTPEVLEGVNPDEW